MSTPITIYITPADLPDFGIQEEALRGIPVPRQVRAISAACRRFDSVLKGQVVFPLVQVGDDAKECVAVLAAFTLMSVRGWSGDGDADQMLLERYDRMLDWLTLIANDKAFPDVTGSASGDTKGRPSARPRAVSSSQQGWSTRGTNNRRSPFTND